MTTTAYETSNNQKIGITRVNNTSTMGKNHVKKSENSCFSQINFLLCHILLRIFHSPYSPRIVSFYFSRWSGEGKEKEYVYNSVKVHRV